jgi:hypothetical protein
MRNGTALRVSIDIVLRKPVKRYARVSVYMTLLHQELDRKGPTIERCSNADFPTAI